MNRLNENCLPQYSWNNFVMYHHVIGDKFVSRCIWFLLNCYSLWCNMTQHTNICVVPAIICVCLCRRLLHNYLPFIIFLLPSATFHITLKSQWTRWHLKSSASRLITQPFIQADRRKHQNSTSLAFVRGIQRWPVNSPHKGPVTRKIFPFDDVIMS